MGLVMDNLFFIMLPAFGECLILVGIHSYLGLHVIKRKVIFVDLALAQIAAMGTTIAFLFGISPATASAFWFSLLLTVVGALIFSLCRVRSDKIPQEAVIGLVYAITAAIGILIIDKAPEGSSHLKHILVGSILWVKWETIGKTALVYAGIGLFHYWFREQFILISEDPEQAWRQGLKVRWWDFLFYLSFGVIITYSVGTAGVLLVFVLLIAPAIMALMLSDNWRSQLVIGWSMGFLVSVAGLAVAYWLDLSTGPAIIVIYGGLLVIMAVIYYYVRAENLVAAIAKTGGVLLVFGFIFCLLVAMGKFLQPMPPQSAPAVCPRSSLPPLDELNESEAANYLQTITELPTLTAMFHHYREPQLRLAIIERTLALAPRKGVTMALEFLASQSYLFDLDSAYQEQLDKALISEQLRAEFANYHQALSPLAEIKVQATKNRWLIADVDSDLQTRQYVIEKSETHLKVYAITSLPPFFMEQLRCDLEEEIPDLNPDQPLDGSVNREIIRQWLANSREN